MWSIIKKAVNSDLSTPLNIPINAIKEKTDLITQIKSKTDLIMGKCQLFLENGTFVVPTGVYAVYLTGCAAGNAGAAGAPGGVGGGGGGAGGEIAFDFLILNLTPGQSIAVTTGTGNTVFGPYLTLTKGGGAPGGVGGGYATPGGKGEGSLIKKGTPYNGGDGGDGGTGTGYGGGGGGGGGGFSGTAGAGGAGASYTGGPGGAGGTGTGYGGGGGGGGGSGGTPGAGGAGRPGFLFVRWL